MSVLKIFLKPIRYVYWYFNNKRNRGRLHNSNFSIICNTCIAGTIYNRLGLKFMTPTINTWISQKDFVKFVNDLNYYLNKEFVKYEDPNRTCPCGLLGDGEKQIEVCFVHYNDYDYAVKKWNERKNRINFDNLYIITSDGNGVSIDELNSINLVCKRIVIFTLNYENEIKNSFKLNHKIKKYADAAYYQADRSKILNRNLWHYEFDYVAWLNNNDEFRI